MTQFQEEILKDRDDNLNEIYASNVYNAPGPDDDDDWINDDDVDSGEDIDEDYTSPAVVPDVDEDDDAWVDDDEDDDLLSDDDEDDEDITFESDDDEVSEGDRLSRGDLGTNFDERPYGRNRRSGRMIDHEPGSTGSGDPNLE